MAGNCGAKAHRKRHRARAAGFALASAMALPIAPAFANGRYPSANQLVISHSNPQLMVLRTTFGILVSPDGGANWDWVCESAVGYGRDDAAEDPAIGLGVASIILGTQEGLVASRDTGCSWAFANGAPTIDVALRPDVPGSGLALSSNPSRIDGGVLFLPALLETRDDAVTWAPYGAPLDALVRPDTVEVTASDPHRVYVSGVKLVQGVAQGVLLASADDGQTWREGAVPAFAPNDEAVLVGAVDPTNADRVYLRIVQFFGGALVVTDDGGRTFRSPVLTSPVPMPGFALSPDGSKVYVGTDTGLLVAKASDLVFARTSSIPIQCLAATDTTLFACSSDEAGCFSLGVSTDDGAHFTPVLRLDRIRGPLRCSATSAVSQCAAQWPALRDALAPPASPTQSPCAPGGGNGADPDGGAAHATPEPARKAASGCLCAGPGAYPPGWALGLLGMAAAIGVFARRARGRAFWAATALVGIGMALVVFAARRGDPAMRGQRLFAQHCARCHALAGLGDPQTATAPKLDGWSTPEWIAAMLHDPDAPELFGRSDYNGGMRSADVGRIGETPTLRNEAEKRAVTLFLASQGDEPGDPAGTIDRGDAAKGEAIVAERCTECHLYKGQGDAEGYSGLAPELSHYGSLAWTRAIIANPAGLDTYRELAFDDVRPGHMPRFDSVLSASDIDLVARWTRSHARRLTPIR
jgi:mono/diheme cytochrome c family protein/photosystem II stability/assembly factor-like uncharacterized protein